MKQEENKFKPILDYVMRPCPKVNKIKILILRLIINYECTVLLYFIDETIFSSHWNVNAAQKKSSVIVYNYFIIANI